MSNSVSLDPSVCVDPFEPDDCSDTAPANKSVSVSEVGEERIRALSDRLNAFAKRMGIEEGIEFDLNIQSGFTNADSLGKQSKKIINLGLIFLIRKEDIPADLAPPTEEPPSKSCTKQEREKWFQWFEKFFQIQEIEDLDVRESAYVNLRKDLKTMIRLLRHPDYESAVDFILCHELAHVKCDHGAKQAQLLAPKAGLFEASCIAAQRAYLAVASSFSSLSEEEIQEKIRSLYPKKIAYFEMRHAAEKEADLLACETLGTEKGAACYLQAIGRKKTSKKPLFTTHPVPATRMEYVSAWSKDK